MKKDKKIILAGAVLLAVFVTGAYANEEPKNDTVQQKILSFNLEGFSEKGAKQWDIQGDSAEVMQQENKIKLNNVVAKAYGDEAEATLKADKGIYDKTKNDVTMEDNIKVTIVNAENLSKNYDILPLSGPPEPKDPGKKAGLTTITCDGEVVFNYEKNEAYFAKNVKVISEDGEIDADKITLFLDVKSKKIREVVAEGNVKITRDKNITFSEKATYVESEKKVILSGRPKLVIYAEGGIEKTFLAQ